ncbi:hypothetical protein M0R45_001980 [Rubus argutus]|uniref:Uncharacterized protein n=1 Tax=Rubus argutus TaxID=59490 RepID=A0AAW1VKK6_RUBAR
MLLTQLRVWRREEGAMPVWAKGKEQLEKRSSALVWAGWWVVREDLRQWLEAGAWEADVNGVVAGGVVLGVQSRRYSDGN